MRNSILFFLTSIALSPSAHAGKLLFFPTKGNVPHVATEPHGFPTGSIPFLNKGKIVKKSVLMNGNRGSVFGLRSDGDAVVRTQFDVPFSETAPKAEMQHNPVDGFYDLVRTFENKTIVKDKFSVVDIDGVNFRKTLYSDMNSTHVSAQAELDDGEILIKAQYKNTEGVDPNTVFAASYRLPPGYDGDILDFRFTESGTTIRIQTSTGMQHDFTLTPDSRTQRLTMTEGPRTGIPGRLQALQARVVKIPASRETHIDDTGINIVDGDNGIK